MCKFLKLRNCVCLIPQHYCLSCCADALQAGAQQFEMSATRLKRKYWWQNLKVMRVWFFVVALSLLQHISLCVVAFGFFCILCLYYVIFFLIYCTFCIIYQLWAAVLYTEILRTWPRVSSVGFPEPKNTGNCAISSPQNTGSWGYENGFSGSKL